MIDPTAKMIDAIYSRINFVDHDDSGIREGLAEVFDMIERDYRVVRRAKPRWERPPGCLCSHLKPGRYKLCPVHGAA